MRCIGSTKCQPCYEQDHKNCIAFDIVDEERGLYMTCACDCIEARECAGFDEEDFARTITAIAKAQAISLGGKP